ncbi:MAG: alpha-1,2-fucosyltransferase [Saccharofermentans sp.]|nr:alpha-1,2-fucosyltransferase [Saccharofermentans sp.]
MIIVSVGFGLGNQMFEYAYYTKLKTIYPDVELKIDTDYSFEWAHNGYELERIFGVKETKCTFADFNKLTDDYPRNCNNKIKKFYYHYSKKIRKILLGQKKSFIRQKDYSEYYPELLKFDTSESYFIQGVFANYKYFQDIEDKIKDIYTFPEITEESNIKWAEAINSSESVSLHIRRGDYIEWGLTLLGDDYYDKAVAYIEEKTQKKCEVFIFTDDPKWAEEKYGERINYHVVTGNSGETSFRDMQLMSMCKHNIVANSSFSFWGAYLNNNPEKIVVSSAKAYDGCANNFSCDDWISM